MYHLKTLKFKDGRSLEIHADDDAPSPRDDDNLGTMVCFHRNYDLGDTPNNYRHEDYPGWDGLEAQIEKDYPDCIILPIYMYEHSGITINTTGFPCPWDSSRIGLIFISRQTIEHEFGSRRTDEEIRGYLRGEVEVYDQHLRGDRWGYIVREKPCETCGGPGKQSDSCWGFYGNDPDGNGMIDHLDDVMQGSIWDKSFEEISLTFFV